MMKKDECDKIAGHDIQTNGDNAPNEEAIKYYWEKFKYRHELYWRLMFRFTISLSFIFLFPFTKKMAGFEINQNLPEGISYLFPAFGVFLTVLFWHILKEEFFRMILVHKRIETLEVGDFRPYRTELESEPTSKLNQSRSGFGKLVNNTFLLGFVSIYIIQLAFFVYQG